MVPFSNSTAKKRKVRATRITGVFPHGKHAGIWLDINSGKR